jgi:AcrR family transcriptional regulator
MADIAEAAGISRATLYVHFKDKDAVLLALADHVVREALRDMEAAWQTNAGFATNLEAAILAKDLPLHRLKHTSPHGGELLDANSEHVAACAHRLEAGFVDFLRSRAMDEAADGGRFEMFGGIPAFAAFVAQAAAGFKTAIASEDHYRTAIRTFATLVESGTKSKRTKPSRYIPK